MKRTIPPFSVSVLAVLLLAASADAQINSAPPALMGQPSYHIYTVPGLIDAGGLATFFSCSNTTSSNIRVGVEVFGGSGGAAANDPSATSLDLLPGGAFWFCTSTALGFSCQSNLGASIGARGTARILATERSGIICTAVLADVTSAPPTSMVQLNIVKKLKQKGD